MQLLSRRQPGGRAPWHCRSRLPARRADVGSGLGRAGQAESIQQLPEGTRAVRIDAGLVVRPFGIDDKVRPRGRSQGRPLVRSSDSDRQHVRWGARQRGGGRGGVLANIESLATAATRRKSRSRSRSTASSSAAASERPRCSEDRPGFDQDQLRHCEVRVLRRGQGGGRSPKVTSLVPHVQASRTPWVRRGCGTFPRSATDR